MAKSKVLKKLDLHDASQRISAYVYGNLLVLAALITLHAEAYQSLHAFLVIIGTGATTYLAHCVADIQALKLLHGKELNSKIIKHELRNATPILSSATIPAFCALLSYFGALEANLATAIAEGTIILRLVFNGYVISRYRQEKIKFSTFGSGIGLAFIAIAVAILKNVLTH